MVFTASGSVVKTISGDDRLSLGDVARAPDGQHVYVINRSMNRSMNRNKLSVLVIGR